MAEKSKDTTSLESMNTRWWESYLVRYFIGFIVGAGCVATIASHFVTPLLLSSLISVSKDGKPDWSVVFWVLALAGLGYCYIASTPITVLHAGRYGRGPVDSQSRYFWLSWVGVLVVSSLPSFADNCHLYPLAAAFLLSFLLAVLIGGGKSTKSDGPNARQIVLVKATFVWFLFLLVVTLWINHFLPKAAPTWVLPLLVLGFPIAWIGFAQYAVLWRLLFEQNEVEAFYKKIFHARRQLNARDVRDTYTHLREHSNSVFIVLVELCLLAFIYSLIEFNAITGHELDLGRFLQLLACGVVIWVLPTVFMWSRANAMEDSFGSDPTGFLGVAPEVKVDDNV